MGLECKSTKSRDTWSNRQIWLWSTKWSRAKANRVLLREHTGHSKYPLPTTQEKTLHMDITRGSKCYNGHLLFLLVGVPSVYWGPNIHQFSYGEASLLSIFNPFILDYFDSILLFRGRYVTQAWPIRTSNFLGHNNYFQDGHGLTQFEIIFEYLLGLLRGRQSRFFPGLLAFAYISLFSCWQPSTQ